LSDASNKPNDKPKKDRENKKHNETDSTTRRKMARCPLCEEQGITVPLGEVEHADNGAKTKSHSDQGKAAPSVLKWDGGHAWTRKRGDEIRNSCTRKSSWRDNAKHIALRSTVTYN